MVRPTSSIWNHFRKENYGGKNIAICRYCDTKYLSPNATKMTKHIEKCIKRPVDMLPSFPTNGEEDVDHPITVYDLSIIPRSDSVASTSSDYVVATPADTLPSPSSSAFMNEPAFSYSARKKVKRDNQSVISNFIDMMPSSEAEKLDILFARAIYASNCPLSLTENMHWKNLFHQIRPSYKVPSRHDLTTRLLEKEYSNVKEINMDKINKAEFLTILTDGWSNIRNESIISFIVATPSPIFYKSIETNHNKHTGVYISEEITKVINEVGGHKVIALVTDNASNMKSAWRILQLKYPELNTLGCSAHGVNLLLGDISKIETFQLIISKSKEVIKYFKNKQVLLSVFTEKQKQRKGTAASTLKLPAETRWSSTLIMFKSLIDGKESLQEAVLQENVDRDIRKLVLDNDIFWASIESLNNVLKPICDGISMIESDSAVLSDVPYVFYNIKNSLSCLKSTPLQTDEEDRFISVVEERKKMFCQPIHFAAYVLDPRYQGHSLNSEEYRIAVEFMSNFPSTVPAEEVIANFAEFQAREGIYSNDAIWSSAKYISPLVWWKGILASQTLSHVAIKLFSIPPSSAACERIFSAFSKTHTILRNRLKNDTVSKLIAIRSNLILQNTKFDSDEKYVSTYSDSD